MTATDQQKISARILAAIAAGASTKDAIDAVLGERTFEKVAGDVYDALRAPR